ncbi:MAG: ABC transporter permease [Candidatus Cryptobacteroides sp.]
MKEIAAFIEKEFKHIFRDVRTTMIVLIMPVIQIVLFGFAISTDVNNAIVDVVGDLSDATVRRIVDKIENNRYLEVGERLQSPSLIDARLRKGASKAAICFGKDFDKDLEGSGVADVRIVCDGSDPNTAQMICNYIKGVIQDEQASITLAMTGNRTPSFRPNVQLVFNPAMSSSYNFVPGVMGLILMLICTMMTSVSIVREKEFGTMELVLVSPVKPFWIILSKLVPYLVLSLVNFVTVILLAHYVMGVPVNGSISLLALSSLIFVGTSLGLGLLISTISSSQQTAMLLCGMGLTMPTMMLSGIIFPCESMPGILQAVSDIIPAKWYIIIIKKVMIQGAGIAAVAKELGILTGMMTLLLGISIKNFKTRL